MSPATRSSDVDVASSAAVAVHDAARTRSGDRKFADQRRRRPLRLGRRPDVGQLTGLEGGKLERRQRREASGWVEEIRQRGCEAALLLHRVDHDVHLAVAQQEVDPERHLRLHPEQISLLPGKIPGLAELHPTQLVSQRLLRQDPSRARKPGKGQLLDLGPDGRGHV